MTAVMLPQNLHDVSFLHTRITLQYAVIKAHLFVNYATEGMAYFTRKVSPGVHQYLSQPTSGKQRMHVRRLKQRYHLPPKSRMNGCSNILNHPGKLRFLQSGTR